MARILLVEDEQFLREIYTEVLIEAGYDVETASDGSEGFQKMIVGGYDLILLDVMMPERDGRQIMLDLQKNNPKKPNKKIMYMTNLSHDGILKESKELGVAGVIIKSDVTPDQFLQVVDKALKN